MKRLGVLAIAANILMVFNLTAMAQVQTFNKSPKGETYICENMGPFGRIAERLDLTDSQKKQIQKRHLQHAEKMIGLKNLMGEKEAKLRTLSTAKKVDMGDINELIEEIGALKIKMMKNKASLKQSFRTLLTDDQRIMFDAHSQRMEKKYRKGKRGGFHHGRKGRDGRGHRGEHRGQNRW